MGLRLADFEVRDAVAAVAVQDAVTGSYHGGEDVLFGARSGAIGIAHLDPRISAVTALRARTAVQQLVSGLRLAG